MKKRHPLAVAALTLITFGVYAYVWLFLTTDELREEAGRDDLSPTLDVILALITVGLWGVWAGYRNAKIAHELIEDRGEDHADRSLPVAAFATAGVFSGWAWPVAIALLQEDYNRAIDLDAARSRFDAAIPYEEAVAAARSGSPRVRVEVAPEAERVPNGVPVSQWSTAPSAPVFESKAPMPIVY